MGREVTETSPELSRIMAQQFTGATVGLFQQYATPDRDGDHLTANSDLTEITTEPDADGYERLTLTERLNPSFTVRGWVGTVDSLFIADDGELLAVVPLLDDDAVIIHDHMDELTPQIWGETA